MFFVFFFLFMWWMGVIKKPPQKNSPTAWCWGVRTPPHDRPGFRRPPNSRSSEITCQPQPYRRQPPQRIQRHRIHLRCTGQPDLPPAAQWRKPILPIRFRKPTRPHRNQKASRQYRDLDIRLRPVRQKALQRAPRQTRLDEYRPEAHPLCLGR